MPQENIGLKLDCLYIYIYISVCAIMHDHEKLDCMGDSIHMQKLYIHAVEISQTCGVQMSLYIPHT